MFISDLNYCEVTNIDTKGGASSGSYATGGVALIGVAGSGGTSSSANTSASTGGYYYYGSSTSGSASSSSGGRVLFGALIATSNAGSFSRV